MATSRIEFSTENVDNSVENPICSPSLSGRYRATQILGVCALPSKAIFSVRLFSPAAHRAPPVRKFNRRAVAKVRLHLDLVCDVFQCLFRIVAAHGDQLSH